MGIKLKFYRIVSNISLYAFYFFIAVAQELWLLLQRKVSIDLKWEKWKLWLIAISLRYSDSSFAERFVEWASTKHIILDQTSQFDWLPTEMLNSKENIYIYIYISTPQQL